jgi:4-amino-4-deoxy-L-arabinose transferase-like glycosyltransferase
MTATLTSDVHSPPDTSRRTGRLAEWSRTFFTGSKTDPRWVRPSLLALLSSTALLYAYGLSKSGWANSFYSAAVQAGTQSWKAFFFGSSDAGNSITVDKPPLSLWPMVIFARIFGLNSWSILIPQAIMGVATTGVLYLIVRRWFSPAAGLVAGVALAVTPVATLMFRYNNPDAMLIFLLTLSVYAVTRALEKAETKWLIWAGAFTGLDFLVKSFQAFLVLPALFIAYLACAPTPLGRRVKQLAIAGLSVIVAGGWWIAIVELWPASSRPYIGGSQTNSVFNLIFGYNGLSRLSGASDGGLGNTNEDAGWFRLFGSGMGTQISWLLPAALVFIVAGFWLTRKEGRTGRGRAALIMWSGWLLVTGVIISLSQGIIHSYYSVAVAPAIAALIGIGAHLAWSNRHQIGGAILGAALALTGIWTYILLKSSSGIYGTIGVVALVGGIVLAISMLFIGFVPKKLGLAIAGAGLIVALAAPTAYSVATVQESHTGALPTAGPSSSGSAGGFGGGGGMGGGMPGGGTRPGGATSTTQRGGGGTSMGGGGGGMNMSGLLDATTPSAAVQKLLNVDASKYTWVAAVARSNNAAGYQLATGHAVMAIGGYNGTDPSPTLAQFKAYVAAGKIHYYISIGSVSSSTTTTAAQIETWVTAHYKSTTVDGVTLYDLTATTTS